MILAVDLGTTVTKVVCWGHHGPLGIGRSSLSTVYSGGGRAEQDPATWWPSVVYAARQALKAAEEGDHGHRVDCIVFSAARQTFVTVDAAGFPTGPGILWSDRRAVAEAAELAAKCGGMDIVRRETGSLLDGASPAAKLAWIGRHEGDVLHRSRWVLSPRDFVVHRMTAKFVTDSTLAQAGGLYDSSLTLVENLVGPWARALPRIADPWEVVGPLLPGPAADFGIAAGVPVVVGAGDRACEVLGVGASHERAMVSWGTTANVSVPTSYWPLSPAPGVRVSRGGLGGYLIEAGLSSAGSFLQWLAGLGLGLGPAPGPAEEARVANNLPGDTNVLPSGIPRLLELASASPPGARGVTALCWLGGARAPWWRDDAKAAFLGLGPEHEIGDLARAAVEAVAFEARRCFGELAAAAGATFDSIAMAGGSSMPLWPDVLAGVTGLTCLRRTTGMAAAAGAALIAGRAIGATVDLDSIDPPTQAVEPDTDLVALYGRLRPVSEAAARAVLGLSGVPSSATDAADCAK